MGQTVGRPVTEGIPGATSSLDTVTQEPPALIRCNRPRPQTSFGPIVYVNFPFMGSSFVPTGSEGVLGLMDPCAASTICGQYSRDYAIFKV